MALVTLEETKNYLRVDSSVDDGLVGVLLSSAGQICADVARLTQEQWDAVNADEDTESDLYSESELEQVRSVMRVALLYAVAYLYEHREEADHHALTLTLRSILFAVREGVVW